MSPPNLQLGREPKLQMLDSGNSVNSKISGLGRQTISQIGDQEKTVQGTAPAQGIPRAVANHALLVEQGVQRSAGKPPCLIRIRATTTAPPIPPLPRPPFSDNKLVFASSVENSGESSALSFAGKPSGCSLDVGPPGRGALRLSAMMLGALPLIAPTRAESKPLC